MTFRHVIERVPTTNICLYQIYAVRSIDVYRPAARYTLFHFISFQGILARRCLCCQEASIRLKKLLLQKGVISSADFLKMEGAPRHHCRSSFFLVAGALEYAYHVCTEYIHR